MHLPGQHPARNHALHNIRTVEAVHAVCADGASLPGFDGACGAPTKGVEVTVLRQREFIEEELCAVPAHRAAFVVEVEVYVVQAVETAGIFGWCDLMEAFRGLGGGFLGFRGGGNERFDGGLVGGLYGDFAPRLVDEVDKVGFAVDADLLFKVFSGGVERERRGLYMQGWYGFEGIEFGPVSGDRAAGLDIAEDLYLFRIELAAGVGDGGGVVA